MRQNTFLHRLAGVLLDDYSDRFTQTTVILPNKRARVFLVDALRQRAAQPIFSPNIISIEDFIQDIAGLRTLDSIELLFQFYEVYRDLAGTGAQPFEQFANWAKTLLQDFNEIDRYLLDPKHVLSYLKDIEDIRRWGIDPEQRTPLLENYINFWLRLPVYYESLYAALLERGSGYQGMIYREAVNNLNHFSENIGGQQFVFAGFNALNAAEERIAQQLMASGQAKIYWDADRAFLEDSYHDAGLFLRRFRESWRHYKTQSFEWIWDDFSQKKQIKVIGTPKTVGQAKIAGKLLEAQLQQPDGAGLDRTALVLGDENLLIPVLHALPKATSALNITMGYSAKNNPAQLLVAKFLKLHTHAVQRRNASYVFYYKDILDLLTHPLIEPYAKSGALVSLINNNNYTFLSHAKLMELGPKDSAFFDLLFAKWEDSCVSVLERAAQLLLQVRDQLGHEHPAEKISKAFVYAIYKVINQLIGHYTAHPGIGSPETLLAIYRQVIDLAEVSFEGEPLTGLQIMGVLESRVLDFDTVIVTSMNEGSFPAGKSQQSFIPYDVKRELGLPTFKEKDAIYTYHFYHLLQRAKTIYLIYNTESEGLDAGEKSRFLTQLEVEKQPNHELQHHIYSPVLPEKAYEPLVIPKSGKVMERLREISEKGFSPSSLTMYIRNPIDFYYKKILRISDREEVEETIALNTLGTIIHESLRVLYEPFVGRLLTLADIKGCFGLLEATVLEQFRAVYKEGEITKGRNLLAFEVAKRNVHNFLKTEAEALENGDVVQLIALEKTYSRWLEHPKLPHPVLIAGNVDRIEQRNGKLRIIDYKTGKVEPTNVTLKQWDTLTQEAKNDKIIQLLAYAFMYAPEAQGQTIEAGIISFKNLRSGFMPFNFKSDGKQLDTVDDAIAGAYQAELVGLLVEILDPMVPFAEKT